MRPLSKSFRPRVVFVAAGVLAGVLAGMLAGVGLGYGLARLPAGTDPIRISAEAARFQIENREAVIGRALTEAEIRDVMDRIVRNEVLVREAERLQLHLKDRDMRKHMAVLMTRVLEQDAPEPSAQDLQAVFDADPERFMLPESFTFEHVFFGDDKAAADTLMSAIAAGAPVPEDAGRKFWLGRQMENYHASQLMTVLGHEFLRRLEEMPPGVWTGPIRSGRGWHVVRLQTVTPPAPLPDLERDRRLREAWKIEALNRDFEKRVAELAKGYRIELPEL